MTRRLTLRTAILLAAISTVGTAAALSFTEAKPARTSPAPIKAVRPVAGSAVYAVPAANRPDCYIVHTRNWDDDLGRVVKQRRTVCS